MLDWQWWGTKDIFPYVHIQFAFWNNWMTCSGEMCVIVSTKCFEKHLRLLHSYAVQVPHIFCAIFAQSCIWDSISAWTILPYQLHNLQQMQRWCFVSMQLNHLQICKQYTIEWAKSSFGLKSPFIQSIAKLVCEWKLKGTSILVTSQEQPFSTYLPHVQSGNTGVSPSFNFLLCLLSSFKRVLHFSWINSNTSEPVPLWSEKNSSLQ